MSGKDDTVFDDGKTLHDSGKTVYEPGGSAGAETVYGNGGSAGAETVYGNGETVFSDAADNPDGDPFARNALLLGTYRIESHPIHGGMGSVWKVRHTGWNTDLAMKRPKPELFADGEARQNFIRECQCWIDLGLHPNIVSCYYVREIGGVPTIFSEWMENGSLENRIEDGTLYEGAGSERELQGRLLDIAIQYARGLRYAHDRGLIHRDVKPDNLLLTKDWQAKAADFGLAGARGVLTVLEEPESDGATRMAGKKIYTPAYCSMEQMDGKVLTRATDIYSWAVSVMEMFYGSRPWHNGVVAGMSCRDYFADGGARVFMPEALRDLLARCMETDPENRPRDFGSIGRELTSIYRDVAGRPYPRPEPETALDPAAGQNNRAISYLDIGKEAEAADLLQRSAGARHPDGVMNLALYRWRRGEISGADMLSVAEDLRKLYPARSGEMDEILRQIRQESCGMPEPPAFRTVIPRSFEGLRSGTAAVSDGRLIMTVRKRWTDGNIYNYVCHFDPETGRLLAQYPPEGEEPKIRFTSWESSTYLSPDGSKLIIFSQVPETQGVFDVIRQRRINEDPFPYDHPEAGEWIMRTVPAEEFFDRNGEIREKYRNVPLYGKKGDADRIYEILELKSWRVRAHAAARNLIRLDGGRFLVRTKKEEIRLCDIRKEEEILLFRPGREDGKAVLKSMSGNIVLMPDGKTPEAAEYAPGQFVLHLCGRFFTLPDLREVKNPGWRERTGNVHPRTVRLSGGNLTVDEAVTNRNLMTERVPDLPHDPGHTPNPRMLKDPEHRRVLIYLPGYQTAWVTAGLDFYPERLRQMNYRVSTPVSFDEAARQQEKEQRLLDDFHRAEQAGDLKAMTELWQNAAASESMTFQTLHTMNRSLAEKCARKGLIRVAEASSEAFIPRRLPEPLKKLPEISTVAPDLRCYVSFERGMIRRSAYPSGRATNEMNADRLRDFGYFGTMHSLCMGQEEEIYAAYQCSTYTGRYENKNYRVACLGREMDRDEAVLEIPGTGGNEEILLLRVTEDNRMMLMYRHERWGNSGGTLQLLDLREKKVIRSLDVSDFFRDSEGAMVPDEMMLQIRQGDTVLELFWDYAPQPREKTEPLKQTQETMKIKGNTLEKYYGEEGVAEAVIPEGLDDIGSGSFEGCELIRSVVIPEGVKYIGSAAFRNCRNLEKVEIQSHSLMLLDRSAFEGCTALREIRMVPGDLRVICERAFAGCKALESFTVPEGVRRIQREAFSRTGLKECGLPSTLEEIGEDAFKDAPIREIRLPESLRLLKKGCFRHTSLREIRIPAGVNVIPEDAFSECVYLERIENAGSIQRIGAGAFDHCSSLQSVQTAPGTDIQREVFGEGIWLDTSGNAAKKTIRKETTVSTYEWNPYQCKAVKICAIRFIPVSPEPKAGTAADGQRGDALEDMMAEMERLARERMGNTASDRRKK